MNQKNQNQHRSAKCLKGLLYGSEFSLFCRFFRRNDPDACCDSSMCILEVSQICRFSSCEQTHKRREAYSFYKVSKTKGTKLPNRIHVLHEHCNRVFDEFLQSLKEHGSGSPIDGSVVTGQGQFHRIAHDNRVISDNRLLDDCSY